MTARLAFLLAATLVVLSRSAVMSPRADRRVAELLRQVDPARLERDVRSLAGFGTRHTLSATDDPKRGIGAATPWALGRLRSISAAAGGRLQVEEDRFTAPAGTRVPQATAVEILVAVLPGEDPDRMLVVSGHLDSRCTNILHLANVTRANLAALADLAWSPPPPAGAQIVVARLEMETTLRWDRTADPACLGYEILWRATTAPDWEGARFVGDVSEATLPLSKDDVLFAVRAVSRAGNRSVPVFPVSGRSRAAE
jgi:hypothetical protein